MKLVAFTTITIQDAAGDITISIEAEESTILPGASTIVRVFTEPLSYLNNVGVTASEGTFTGGTIETDTIEDEDIALTKTTEDGFASGNIQHAPVSTPTYSILASIGGTSPIIFSGSSVQATSPTPWALVVRNTYNYQFKKYTFTAPVNPKATIAVLMGFLNG